MNARLHDTGGNTEADNFASLGRALLPDEPAALPPRQAALLLHGVSRRDRAWLLQRLDPTEREAVLPLLKEVDSLGLAVDDKTLASWCDSAQPHPTPAPGPSHPAPKAKDPVAPLTPDLPWPSPWRLARALHHEPDAIVLATLRAQPRWVQRTLLLTWPPVRRRPLASALRAPAETPAPGLVRAIKAGLAS